MSNNTENSENAKDQLDFKKVLPVFVIVFIDLLGLTIIIPLLPLYAASYGADPFLIGMLSATYPLMQFFGAPLLGRLSDRFGRRPVLLVSQVGTLIGFLILGFANTLWLLFLSRFIDGISGANIATTQAIITDSTTEKTRTQGLGLIGAAFGLGFIWILIVILTSDPEICSLILLNLSEAIPCRIKTMKKTLKPQDFQTRYIWFFRNSNRHLTLTWQKQ